MAETALSDARQQIQRMKSALANIREKGEHAVGVAANGGAIVMGGITAAIIDNKFPNLPSTSFPTKVAVGGLAAAVGLAEGVGKHSDLLAYYGFSLLSSKAEEMTTKALAA
jgi:hypothetical protein